MWQRFLWSFGIVAGAALAAVVLAILLVDPLGVSPIRVVQKSGFAVPDRRFTAPQIIVNRNFDSFLVGTSTIHLVDPERASAAFGGHFATLAIHGGTPYELNKMMHLIGRNAPQAKRVVVGLDARRWCKAESYDQYNPKALFPDWLYNKNRIDDFSALFNLQMLRWSRNQLEIARNKRKPIVPENGYHTSLDDSKWTLEETKKRLYRKAKNKRKNAVFGLDDADDAADALGPKHDYPDLALLKQGIDALPADAELIVLVMPSHITAVQGRDHNDIERCKRRIAKVVSSRNGYLIDFRIDSDWTNNDANFWDENHIRIGFAQTLIGRAKDAVDRRADAEDGVYRVLAAPGAAPASAEAAKRDSESVRH